MMQTIPSKSRQSLSVNLMKSSSLRSLVSADSIEVLSHGSKRYLNSDLATENQIILRMDSPSETGNATRIPQEPVGQPDWMDMNLNQVTPDKKSQVMVLQHVTDGAADLNARVSRPDAWRDQLSTISIDLGIVKWHVRRRDFVETGSNHSNNRFASKLTGFENKRPVESIGSHYEHRLDFARNAESEMARGAAPVPGHLDLVTWCVRRRQLIETATTWLGTDDSNEVAKRVAGQRLNLRTIPFENCGNALDGKSTVPANLDVVTWCIRRPHLIEVAKNSSPDHPVRNSIVDRTLDRLLVVVCNLDMVSEGLDIMPRLKRNEFDPVSLYSLPVSRSVNGCDILSAAVERTCGGRLPDANQREISFFLDPQSCKTVGTAADNQAAVGDGVGLPFKPWDTARGDVQDRLHTLVRFESDATFAMLSPPSRCSVQFATCSYLRGNGGFPHDWAQPVMETVGLHAQGTASLNLAFVSGGASIASDVETETRSGGIRLDASRQEAVCPSVSNRNRKIAVPVSVRVLAERDEPQRKKNVSMAHALNGPQQVSGWDDCNTELSVAKNAQRMPQNIEFNEAIRNAVSSQQVAEDHFPPLSTFELPQVIISGPFSDDSILDSVGVVTMGIRDARPDSAEIGSGIAGDRTSESVPLSDTSLSLDSTAAFERRECVTKVTFRRQKSHRESRLIATSLSNYLNASWSLSESWGIGSMQQPTETRFLVMTDKRPLDYLEDHLQAILWSEQFVSAAVQKETAELNAVTREIVVAGCTLQTQVQADLRMAKSGDQKSGKTRSLRTPGGDVAAIGTAQQSIQFMEASGIPTCSDMREFWAA